MQKIVNIGDFSYLTYICGTADKNLRFLESELNVTIDIKSNGILLKGDKANITMATKIIDKMIELGKEGIELNDKELGQYLSSYVLGDEKNSLPSVSKRSHKMGINVSLARKKIVFPKTKGQKDYINTIEKYDVVFAIGPAGTGKTYLAMAVNYLLEKKVSRIILTRPAIEAGESLGFLPGDMHDKLGPYLRPLYDALYDMIEAKTIEGYLEAGSIEIVPLAYMRGRTLNNAFVILDEAQNCTSDQLRMFLTRLGFDSKTVITGDITQSDLPGGVPKGILEAIDILSPIKGIKFINLEKKDVVRHLLIQKIIHAYEDFHSKKTDKS